MWITGTGSLADDPLASTDYTDQNSYTRRRPANADTVYKLYIRVKVCDAKVQAWHWRATASPTEATTSRKG